MAQRQVCRYWSEGRCRHGKNCRFLHPSNRNEQQSNRNDQQSNRRGQYSNRRGQYSNRNEQYSNRYDQQPNRFTNNRNNDNMNHNRNNNRSQSYGMFDNDDFHERKESSFEGNNNHNDFGSREHHNSYFNDNHNSFLNNSHNSFANDNQDSFLNDNHNSWNNNWNSDSNMAQTNMNQHRRDESISGNNSNPWPMESHQSAFAVDLSQRNEDPLDDNVPLSFGDMALLDKAKSNEEKHLVKQMNQFGTYSQPVKAIVLNDNDLAPFLQRFQSGGFAQLSNDDFNSFLRMSFDVNNLPVQPPPRELA